MAKSYRAHFKKVPQPVEGGLFIKDKYEYAAFCNSRFASLQENILVRLQNSMVMAINGNKKSGLMAKYIIVILDDDLIEFLGFVEEGVATLLGSWVEWLTKMFRELIQARSLQLPAKSKKYTPFIYWVAAPTHTFFTKETNNLRVKFNLSLESVIRSLENDHMRVMKIKDGWDTKNSHLVINNRISEVGLTTYWAAIDASFKYNSSRREVFLARQLIAASRPPQLNQKLSERSEKEVKHDDRSRSCSNSMDDRSSSRSPVSRRFVTEKVADPMRSFFRRHSSGYVEFQRGSREEYHSGGRHTHHKWHDRFMLPCPQRRY